MNVTVIVSSQGRLSIDAYWAGSGEEITCLGVRARTITTLQDASWQSLVMPAQPSDLHEQANRNNGLLVVVQQELKWSGDTE